MNANFPFCREEVKISFYLIIKPNGFNNSFKREQVFLKERASKIFLFFNMKQKCFIDRERPFLFPRLWINVKRKDDFTNDDIRLDNLEIINN